MLSIPHMIVLFVLVLVVFGPQKLPELARTLGKLMAEFRKASTDFKGAFEEEMRNIERQAVLQERQKAAAAATAVTPAEPATQGTAPAAEAALSGAESDARASEAPVITPVAEAVPRSAEEHIDEKPETAAVSGHTQDASHDASHDQQPA
jgi:sec-independent protein translocase protein TatB